MKGVLGEALPLFEAWLRGIVRDEVDRALDADHGKKIPSKQYTRAEVCRMLHISMPTLWAKTKSGEISATKVGRRILYDESEVNRLINK